MHFAHAIIGGGLAAGYAAQVFADAESTAGSVAIFSQENMPPYERPPLSKTFLDGEEQAGDTLINAPDFYADHDIKLFLNTRVTGVDFDRRRLSTDNGEHSFDKLLIVTGSSPRTFAQLGVPGADLENIHYLRRLSQARAIREQMEAAERAVVIGGSFIGMEVSAVLAENGVATTLTFPESRVWEALFTPAMSDFFSSYYRERGVDLLPGADIARFEGKAGRVQRVVLDDDRVLPADFVVAGIGVRPNLAIFRDTALQLDDGVLVNRFLETNVPGVFAAGDVARYRDVLGEGIRRLPHWDNAYRQGQHAARAMLGRREVYRQVPYFFSDVFDLSYEFWGDSHGADVVIQRGDLDEASFSVWWLKDGRLRAAFIMDRPEEEREAAPRWIESGVEIDSKRLSNDQQPLTAARETPAAA